MMTDNAMNTPEDEAAADRAILRTGRDWSAPKRRDLLLDNLTASPAHPPRHPVKLGEVG